MAVDSAVKRFSFLGFANPTILHVIPEGAIGVNGRATLLDLYCGIALDDIDITYNSIFFGCNF